MCGAVEEADVTVASESRDGKMARKDDEEGYNILIDGIRRTYRDQLGIAIEAAQYFKRMSFESDVSIFDRRKKVSIPID
jgi:hypothetical protein